MTKRRWFEAAATLGTVASLAALAAAGPVAGDETRAGRRGGGRGVALAEYLGLTEQQKASWQALHEQQRQQMKPVLEEGRALREKLRAAIEAKEPDPRAVGEATLAMEAHRRQVRATREAFQSRLEDLLSPDQKQKLEAFEAARRSMGGGRDGHRGPRAERGGPREARPIEG